MNIHFGKIIHAISLFYELCIAYHVRKENSTFRDAFICLLLMIPVIVMMLPITFPVFLAMDVSHPFPAACLISSAGMATAGFILMLIENRRPSLFKIPEIRPLKQIKSFGIYYILSLALTFLYLLFCLILLHFLITLTSVN